MNKLERLKKIQNDLIFQNLQQLALGKIILQRQIQKIQQQKRYKKFLRLLKNRLYRSKKIKLRMHQLNKRHQPKVTKKPSIVSFSFFSAVERQDDVKFRSICGL